MCLTRIPTIARLDVGLSLTLTISLSACASYQPLEANCFVDPDEVAAAPEENDLPAATLSTRGAAFSDPGAPCHFTPLATGP